MFEEDKDEILIRHLDAVEHDTEISDAYLDFADELARTERAMGLLLCGTAWLHAEPVGPDNLHVACRLSSAKAPTHGQKLGGPTLAEGPRTITH